MGGKERKKRRKKERRKARKERKRETTVWGRGERLERYSARGWPRG